MRKIGLMLLLFASISLRSQVTLSKLPEYLPPTPEVSALIKGAELSATMHTGAATASIPLYDLKVKDYTLPINLSYATTGAKANEIPSRVGLGWVLNAGGVITRIVEGKPDEFCTFPTPIETTEFTSYTQTAYDFLNFINPNGNAAYDTRPDLYKYSINGVAGSFIFKRDGSIMQFPMSNNTITASKDGNGHILSFQIKDGNGIKYDFDGVKESTISHNLQHSLLNKQNIVSSWFLTKITLPTKQYIGFNYGNLTTEQNNGQTQIAEYGLIGGGLGVGCTVGQLSYDTKSAYTKYNAVYLSSIYTSNGFNISLSYENRPDNSGDKRLKNILVTNYASGPVKKIELSYIGDTYSGPSILYNSIYQLKKVSFLNVNDNNKKRDIVLSYKNEDLYPAAVTSINAGSDFLGYANGKGWGIPFLPEYADLIGNYNSGDRSPDFEVAKNGILEKITYPTGGTTTYEYEPNTKEYWTDIPNKELTVAHTGGNGPVSGYNTIYTKNFSCPKTQSVRLYFITTWQGSGSSSAYDISKSAYCYLKDLTTNSEISFHNEDYGTFNINTGLTAGHNYQLKVEVRNTSDIHAKAYVDYDIGVGTHFGLQKENLFGLRVKSIKNFDPVTNKTNSKFYKYRFLNDTTTASALMHQSYGFVRQGGTEDLQPGALGGAYYFCPTLIISSNNLSIAANAAGPVTYHAVLESDDEYFANGVIEHKFLQNTEFVPKYQLIGKDVPALINPDNETNGKEWQTNFYDKNRGLVKSIENTYTSQSNFYQIQQKNYLLNERYETVTTDLTYYDEEDFRNWDVIAYDFTTRYTPLTKTVTKEFANGETLINTIEYFYTAVNNTSPTQIKTTNSKGEIKIQNLTYPNQISGNSAYTNLTGKNIINSPVISEDLTAGSNVFKATTNYSVNPSTTLTLPNEIKNKIGTHNEFTSVEIYNYDDNGNTLLQGKPGDIKQSFMWNYHNTYMIANVTNVNNVEEWAYTSFEADNKGNWEYSAAEISDNTAPTGQFVFDLSNEDLTFAVNYPNNTYTLTLWSKNGVPVVGAYTPTAIRTISNGWTLYKYSDIVVDPEVNQFVTISGSALIDEVRLYPSNALMKTFAYKQGIGVTDICDINNNILNYNYNGFGELENIKDDQENIIKQFDYGYKVSPYDCPVSAPNWQPTGNTKCSVNGGGNANGQKLQEEHDLSMCSDTYLQYRWVSIGNSPDCPPGPVCGISLLYPEKKMVNGVCETGTKIYTGSYYAGNLVWICIYHYKWSDNSISQNFEEGSSTVCPISID